MKKKKTLKLLSVAIIAGLCLFVGKVSAEGITEYPDFGNGNSVYFVKTDTFQSTCDITSGNPDCKEYIVSEDDGISDALIVLTEKNNTSNTFILSKNLLSGGYIVKSDTAVDYCVENCGDGPLADGLKLIYFLPSQAADIINGADEFDTVVITGANVAISNFYDPNKDLTIAKDVTLRVNGIEAKSVVNNGIINTSSIYTDTISGTGTINLLYDATGDIGNGPFDGTPLLLAERLKSKNITGVKVNVKGVTDLSGTSFGYVGPESEFTEEEAQAVIDMYNKVRGPLLNGYKVILKSYDIVDPTTVKHYYGELALSTPTTIEIKLVDGKYTAVVKDQDGDVIENAEYTLSLDEEAVKAGFTIKDGKIVNGKNVTLKVTLTAKYDSLTATKVVEFKEISNPKTLDNMGMIIMMSIVSLLGVGLSLTSIKKRMN